MYYHFFLLYFFLNNPLIFQYLFLKYLLSVSTKCGFPPACLIALTVPTKVKDGTNTSLFFFSPSTCKQILSATVPLRTVMTSLDLVISLNHFQIF